MALAIGRGGGLFCPYSRDCSISLMQTIKRVQLLFVDLYRQRRVADLSKPNNLHTKAFSVKAVSEKMVRSGNVSQRRMHSHRNS
jgi:hypothetical protein